MNHRRDENPHRHRFTFLSMFVGAIVAAAGGILYVYYMNRQVETNRELKRVEMRIKEHELVIMNTRRLIDDDLGRYLIREKLVQQHSSLKPIAQGVVEDVQPKQPRTVASAVP
ncbi:MAG: hypothetical protein WCH40_01635 [Verrucomicrobiales bacterium]|jgi:hypothetical protein